MLFNGESAYDFEEMQEAIKEMAPIMAKCEMIHSGEEYDRVVKYMDDISHVIRIPSNIVVEEKYEEPEEGYAQKYFALKSGYFKNYIEEISSLVSYFVVKRDDTFYIAIDH